MRKSSKTTSQPTRVMVLGVGAFAHSTAQILKEKGAAVSTYLTRDYAQYPPSLAGPTYRREEFPSPVPLLRRGGGGILVAGSVDWGGAGGENEGAWIPI